MPKELTLLEEFDIIAELQFPDFVYTSDSLEEKIAFTNYIGSLSSRRILLFDDGVFYFPFAVAGLREQHIETIIKDGDHSLKEDMIFNLLSNSNFLEQVSDFTDELDKRGRSTENSTRLKNILQYLRDNKYII